ncbi:MAG: serine/threonine-protein kinase [Litoreibacter sp.]
MAEIEDQGGFDPTAQDCLQPGTQLMDGQYTVSRFLSSGGFGITYLAKDSLNREVVIKECYADAFCIRRGLEVFTRTPDHAADFTNFRNSFMREAHSIAKLKHPNIVGVHHVFEANNTAYMALDLVQGRDLIQIIDDPYAAPEPRVINSILIKLLDAIDTVHEQDMLHRDISPDNILLGENDEPVLIDFGNAREEVSKKSRAMSAMLVVKDGYSPQEFYIAGSKQVECSDLYALAATFFHFITGEAPPNSQVRLLAKGRSEPDPYVPLNGRILGYSPIFLETIDLAMELFPADRIQTAKDWMARIDTTKRREIAINKAKSNDGIEQTIHDLLQNTQEVVRVKQDTTTAGPRPVVKAKPAVVEAPKAHPFPELTELPDEKMLAEPEPTPPPAIVKRLENRLDKQKKRPSRLKRFSRVLLLIAIAAIFLTSESATPLIEWSAPYLEPVLVRAAPLIEFASPYLEPVKEKADVLVEVSAPYLAPVLERGGAMMETAAPYLEPVLERVKGLVEQGKPYLEQFMESINERFASN